MTKFELPEKPKKTNTSEDFNNLRTAVDELDKFDYVWKTYANKADRRINAANKNIEELEIENQRLVAENLTLKTLVDSAKPQQALPVVPDFIGKFINTFGTPEDGKYINYAASYPKNQKELEWIDNHQKTWLTALLIGYTVEKPQLFYLKNKLTTSYLALDINTGYYEHWGEEIIPKMPNKQGYKISFTKQEIEGMDAGSYEQIKVEDGE
ncbi:DUF1642 domain-containing protein [Lactococcus lactis]|uniref:DUF1642 domain-containing protein n=1 Tax=Lactococcus lactis TaxID=1358 RepID=UPI00223C19D4|nr:DUF1642 domain-containing protein [Lactococcus lactis]MCT1170176.1 DUF1642 domain-containing protein [Lactococcus lactis]